MKRFFSFFVLASCLSLTSSLMAQWSFSTSVDLQSRYVWRGQPLGGEGPSVQPGATVSWNGLSLGVWGAYNIGISSYQELDWSLSYSLLDDNLTLLVTDYAFPFLAPTYHYFDYANNHVLEAGVQYTLPNTNLGVSLYANFYGADATTPNGDLVYSSYAELNYTLPWESQGAEFDFALGAALNGNAGYSFYGNDGFGVVNISAGATKTLEVSPSLKLPCYGRVVVNPVANKMFLLCGTQIEL